MNKKRMINNSKKVSVMMATYNRGYCIGRAIESIMNQTYQNWELMVIDDKSTDNTEEVVKSYISRDERIKYLKLEKNQGCSGARNEGMKICTGDYITFLDSDDEYDPTKIEKQVKVFLNTKIPNLGIVSCGAIDHRDGIEYNRRMPIKREDYYKSLLAKRKSIGVGSPFMMIPSSIIKGENTYFDPQMPAAVDWDIAVRICRKYTLDFVPEHLVLYHHHSGDRMYNPDSAVRSLKMQYTKYRDWLIAEPDAHLSFVKNAASLIAFHKSIGEGKDFIEESLSNFKSASKRRKLKIFKLILDSFKLKYFKLFYLKYFNKT
ncbi:glycosyltransferase [Antarcticibacterium sp. 1MA-6-2]|uniref:glycosyltransferase family 2 protein n=1 Tax=Antarcticibacterium sp. 1MA-6-2 TaxID=2908210 RepID=UPI001F1B8254|nr:glycosyltransferase family 2 protein [Antarcticibacterium sp. 1MA-6-2]UJH91313.1 glycosyltransferase [Antarcticibacterium sp. 1MA-6-2]